MNRPWTRPIHRLAHRLDRLGWWLEDPLRRRRKKKALIEAEWLARHNQMDPQQRPDYTPSHEQKAAQRDGSTEGAER